MEAITSHAKESVMPGPSATRRRFLETASVSSATVLAGSWSLLAGLPPVSADEATLSPKLVPFDDHIEPLVQLIEDTPREKLLEEVATRIRRGRSYREVLAALLLAGIRNVQPRPSVGFKFHCVLVVNACHLASLSGPDEDRWLPIFWALDYFKSSQADEVRRGGWRMKPVNEAAVPNGQQARKLFISAMDQWDVEQADAATAGIVRHLGATEVFQLLATYAARDYRSIGHKAIFLANAWRTLQVIGWQFAEPILRSLTFALLNHGGEANPAKSDHPADRPWRDNGELLAQLPASWRDGQLDNAIPPLLFEAFRAGTPQTASQVAVDALSRGVSPQSVWDGVFVGAGELLMRQPGIIGLHGLTTANAMHYLYRNVANDALRRRLLLQACAFNPMFRESAKGRGQLAKRTIEELSPQAPSATDTEALAEITQAITSDRPRAAAKLYGFLDNGGSYHDFLTEARRLLFAKGRDAHDYKFTSAVLEDASHVSPGWRNQFVALSVFNLKGATHPDNSLVKRARAALS